MQKIIESDMKALEIYLKLGHSKKEAFDAFCKVFKHPDKNRYKEIKKYITDFDNGTDLP